MSVVYPQSHEEWLDERKLGIGASDAGPILGMSKWKSNVELWEEKTGVRKAADLSWNKAVQYGHDAEPYIRSLFKLDHPEYEVVYESPYKIIRNDEHPFIFCTPDGELTERDTGRHGGLEIKTTEILSASQWAEWKDRIPDQYYCQVVWQMIAAGWEFVILKAQIKWHTKDGDLRIDTREYRIERDECLEDIDYTLQKGIEFWDMVTSNKRPNLILPEI